MLDNRLVESLELLRAQPESPFHLVGLGIAAFLKAILSREDAELREVRPRALVAPFFRRYLDGRVRGVSAAAHSFPSQATETLLKAETVATAEVNVKRPKGDKTGAYPAGIEYKLLQADAVLGQALTAVLSESYVEFAKAVWKLNKAYKVRRCFPFAHLLRPHADSHRLQILASIQKTVFPGGIAEDESLDSVFRKLNEHYLAATTAPAPSAESSSGGGFFSSWGRKRAPAVAASLRHSSSSSALGGSAAQAPGTPSSASASAPGSHLPSENASTTDLAAGVAKASLAATPAGTEGAGDNDDHPAPLWAGDRLTTTVISGAALGSGMFGLIFSSAFLFDPPELAGDGLPNLTALPARNQ